MKLKKLGLLIVPIILIIFTSCSPKPAEPKNPVVSLCGNIIGASVSGDTWTDDYLLMTLTFYDTETNWFAAAGHNTDWDIAGNEKPYNAYYADSLGIIEKINESDRGLDADLNEQIGVCVDADDYGLYGYMTDGFTPYGQLIPIANINEISYYDPAFMYYTIEGREPESCEIEIITIELESNPNDSDIWFKITDKDFLEKYREPAYGMSGSPIIQNGKLIGAFKGHVIGKNGESCFATFSITMYDNMIETYRNYKGESQT